MGKSVDADAMKLLLSSADRMQIERFARILFVAGIPSEIHEAHFGANPNQLTGGAELWIQNDGDYAAAVELFTGGTQHPRAT
jgi:hypothetical protein